VHALIITGKDADLKWISDPMNATGFAVNLIKAYSMDEAIRLIKAVKFDIVMYDINFSKETMQENLKMISALECKAPLILLTNKSEDASLKEALQSGADYHLIKNQQNFAALTDSFRSLLMKNIIHYN